MKLFVKDSVNLHELCKGWDHNMSHYWIESSCSNEYCHIDKETREVTYSGYINMINNYINEGIMYYSEHKIFPVVTLCGSTKFKEDFLRVQKELTLQGYVVLSVFIFSHSDNEIVSEEKKDMLMKIHKQKIDMSDGIYIINKDGYIGEGLKEEIEYALSKGKTITYME